MNIKYNLATIDAVMFSKSLTMEAVLYWTYLVKHYNSDAARLKISHKQLSIDLNRSERFAFNQRNTLKKAGFMNDDNMPTLPPELAKQLGVEV